MSEGPSIFSTLYNGDFKSQYLDNFIIVWMGQGGSNIARENKISFTLCSLPGRQILLNKTNNSDKKPHCFHYISVPEQRIFKIPVSPTNSRLIIKKTR